MKRIKTATVIGWIVVVALVIVSVGAVVAQRGPRAMDNPGGPGGPGGMMPPPVIVKAGTTGVFVLMGATLTKYTPELKEAGTLKLIDSATSTTSGQPKPPAAGVMLIAPGVKEKVLVIIGEKFFSVDAATLTIAAKAALPKIEQPAPPDSGTALDDQPAPGGPGGPGMPGCPMMKPMGPPPFELQGKILYAMRLPQIFGINIEDGSIVGPVTLPKPDLPTPGN